MALECPAYPSVQSIKFPRRFLKKDKTSSSKTLICGLCNTASLMKLV